MGPKKKSKLARSTSNARRMQITRALETPEDAQARLAVQQARQNAARARETPVQRQTRQATDSAQMATARAKEDNAAELSRQAADRERHAAYRFRPWKNMYKAAFTYDISLHYEDNPKLNIGGMTVICRYCGARKWEDETVGMCCSAGRSICLLSQILQSL